MKIGTASMLSYESYESYESRDLCRKLCCRDEQSRSFVKFKMADEASDLLRQVNLIF